MENPEKPAPKPGDPIKVVILIGLSTGEVKQHIIDIPENKKIAKMTVDSVMDRIRDSMDSVGDGKQMLALENPYTLYNVSHIAYVQPCFETPEQWEEIVNGAMKEEEPLGFRPS